MSWIGFDIGGTFTDLVLLDFEAKRVFATKTPSSRTDPGAAAVRGIRDLLAMSGRQAGEVERVVHGTTIATNALIEGDVARVGFLCNRGFRDVVEIARMFRDDLYDVNFTKTRPIVPRNLRREIAFRQAVDGAQLVDLDENDVTDAVAELVAQGVEAFAVGLLHSYAYPDAELRVREIVLDRVPGGIVTLSHEVSKEYGEFERWTTAIVNAALMPKMRDYLRSLESRFAEIGIDAPVEVMQSNGGVVPVEVAAQFPVRLLESGPAGGVAGMARLGALAGIDRIITFDMGGTSLDVCVVRDGKPAFSTERKIAGHPVRAMMADIHSIGAGGGSLARVDASGTLHVGPASAGADPGPVALRNGGTVPTITDADIVLGYINTDRYCAGKLPLDADAARAAIADVVATPTGTTVDQSALGILRLAARNMAGAIRNITTQRGIDPRDFSLVASGGAGPVHAGLVARELRIPRVIIPAYPALLSAQGMLFADFRADASQSLPGLLADLDLADLNGALADLTAIGQGFLRGGGAGEWVVDRFVELCYEGQQHGVSIPLPNGPIDEAEISRLAVSLDEHFMGNYGFVPAHNVAKLLNVRVLVEKRTSLGEALRSISVREESLTEAPARTSRRMVFEEHPDGIVAPVFDRAQLAVGEVVPGPAVIEEDFSTIVVYPGQHAWADESGNVVLASTVEASDGR